MAPELKVEEQWSMERCVIIEEFKVTKRELSDKELVPDLNGKPLQPYYYRERLYNEAATLKYIASHTTIPVPECRLYTKDGLLHLETKRINGILLRNVPTVSQLAAFRAVNEQILSEILPQLRSLHRNVIGSVDPELPVFPPSRVYGFYRGSWERIQAKGNCHFVLCHNDLSPHNIFIDPKTFKIVGIIDWEFAGFFPESYELPLWNAIEREDMINLYDEAYPGELALFGLQKKDLEEEGECQTNHRIR